MSGTILMLAGPLTAQTSRQIFHGGEYHHRQRIRELEGHASAWPEKIPEYGRDEARPSVRLGMYVNSGVEVPVRVATPTLYREPTAAVVRSRGEQGGEKERSVGDERDTAG
jgi:hypothetical protein